MDRSLLALFGAMVLAAAPLPVAAQVAPPGPLYDPTQLPAFHGTLQLFSFTPRGDIDGFVLDDGTEVKTPPHLTTEIARAVRPGDKVTIHGLKAASLSLVQALSVSSDATGATVIDRGPPPPGRAPVRDAAQADAVAVTGTIRLLLHGPRGDINGALLTDGTVLKLPPPEAERFGALLVPGGRIAATGLRRSFPAGAVVDLTAVGPAGGPLRPVAGAPRSSLALPGATCRPPHALRGGLTPEAERAGAHA